MSTSPNKARLIDNPTIVETYANKLIGVTFDGGNVVLTFGSTRHVGDHVNEPPSPDKPPSVYVTNRLALAPRAAVELVNGLSAILRAMAKRPTAPPVAPVPGGKPH